MAPAKIDESPGKGEPPNGLALRLAEEKALAALSSATRGEFVLAADTIVVAGNRIMGKPVNEEHAYAMLSALRGRTHTVISALVLLDSSGGGQEAEVCTTEVPMRDYAEEEMRAYIESGSPMDKAGAYGIQDSDFGIVDIAAMSGCFANVMGLPLCHLARAMLRHGLEVGGDVPSRCIAHTGYACKIYPAILEGSA